MNNESNYVPARKGGRCWNGAHRDSGIVIHAVEPMREDCSGYWGTKSLCGTEPGIRGYGWTESKRPVNCGRCLKKIAKASKQS